MFRFDQGPDASAVNAKVAVAERELRNALEALTHGQCFLLTDCSLRAIDVEEPGWERYGAAPHCTVPLEGAKFPQTHWPRLTSIRASDPADAAFFKKSVDEAYHERCPERLRNGRGRSIGGWLASSAPIETVASHLGSVMIQRHPNGRNAWLRLQDPSVIWAVGHILTDPQRNAVLGPVEHLFFFDPVGELVDMAHCAVPPVEELRITEEQWNSIDCVKPINMAFRDWYELLLTDQLDPAFAAALWAIRRAKSLGFSDDKDLAYCGWLAISVHPRFDFHPLVVARMRARSPGDFFSGLVSDLREEDWKRIAREAPP